MLYIAPITKYPYRLASETLSFRSKVGNALQMDFMQGYSAMFFGKVPYSALGKKYAIVSDSSTKERLSIDGWTPELKNYFETRKQDRKSTRLNSSHVRISYAVFCLKKKKKKK